MSDFFFKFFTDDYNGCFDYIVRDSQFQPGTFRRFQTFFEKFKIRKKQAEKNRILSKTEF